MYQQKVRVFRSFRRFKGVKILRKLIDLTALKLDETEDLKLFSHKMARGRVSFLQKLKHHYY